MNESSVNVEKPKLKRKLRGVVVSIKCEKSAVVRVSAPKMHKRYLKQMRWSKNYLVHDQLDKCAVGDKVEIVECVPKSKKKHFELASIMEKSSTI